MSNAAVVVQNLTKRFGPAVALNDLTCEIRPGEVVGLLGPNGAGKTTTLKLLLGLLRPSAGSAHILGLDCTTQSREVKTKLGYTPDEPAFFEFLTGREVLDFVREVRGLDSATTWARLDLAVALLNLGPDLDKYVGGYSLGMKKKLALLTAIAHQPQVLLLDEPTNALDPTAAAHVRALLQTLADRGAAVLVSTHLLPMANELCDRLLILRHGQLIAQGTPEELKARAGASASDTLEAAFLKLVD